MQRNRLIDLTRGVAVITMVIFHLAFDLDFFNILNINLDSLFWKSLALTTQIIFIYTSGMTIKLAYKKNPSIQRRLKQTLKLAFFALAITLITWQIFPGYAITFGILHFFALATLITLPVLPLINKSKNAKLITALLGATIIIASQLITKLPNTNPLLFTLGLSQHTKPFLDYFPLIPWYGLFLLGLATPVPQIKKPNQLLYPLEWLGHHTLAIYLIHQPLIYLALKLL